MSYGIEYLPPSITLPVFNPDDFPVATDTADSNKLRIIQQETATNQNVINQCTTLIEQLGNVVAYQILPVSQKFGRVATIGAYSVVASVPKLMIFNINLATNASTKGIRQVNITLTGNVSGSYTSSWQTLGSTTALAIQQRAIAIQFPFSIPITDTNTLFTLTLTVSGSQTAGTTDWTINENTTYYPTLSPTDVYVLYL